MAQRSSRILTSVIVILTLLLASCSSGSSSGNPTSVVPATGQTAAAPGGGAAGQGTATTGAGTGAAAGAATGTATTASGGAAGGAATGTATTAAGGAAAGAATGTATTAAGGAAAGAATGTATTAPGGAAAGAATGTATTTAGGTTGGQAAGSVTPWKGQKIGGSVKVLAVWGGTELDNFNAMIKPFTEQTGVQVQVESTRDLANVLQTRIQGGNPPDLAGIPNPGQLVQLAKAGSLLPLDQILDQKTMQQQYDPGFLKLASVDGKMYGIFTKASVKSLVWYDPKVWQQNNWTPPKTWEDLQALEKKMQATGVAPWCIGLDGGAGSGWPGTDWVEDILLHQSGPDVYDQWVQHKIPWTDPKVKQAWTTFGTFVNDPKMVYGGPQGAVATQFGQAFNPMFNQKPGCYMLKQADFITSFFTQQFPNLKAGTDYNFFVFPSENPQYASTLEVAGDLFGMFKDTPQSRALIQYLTTPDAQSIWASKGGFLSANKLVDPAKYPDDTTRQIAKMLTSASSVRFDGSDQLPQGTESAFSQAILQYPGHADQLDSILQNIESQAQSDYTK